MSRFLNILYNLIQLIISFDNRYALLHLTQTQPPFQYFIFDYFKIIILDLAPIFFGPIILFQYNFHNIGQISKFNPNIKNKCFIKSVKSFLIFKIIHHRNYKIYCFFFTNFKLYNTNISVLIRWLIHNLYEKYWNY